MWVRTNFPSDLLPNRPQHQLVNLDHFRRIVIERRQIGRDSLWVLSAYAAGVEPTDAPHLAASAQPLAAIGDEAQAQHLFDQLVAALQRGDIVLDLAAPGSGAQARIA